MSTPRDEQHVKLTLEGIASTGRLLGLTPPKQDYTISGEKVPARPYLSPGQALTCLELVRAYLGPDCDPKLYRDHEGPFWNISYEGGPEEWAYQITERTAVAWPSWVHVECVAASWCISLHPVTEPSTTSAGHALVKQWDNAMAQGSEWAKERVAARMAEYLRGVS